MEASNDTYGDTGYTEIVTFLLSSKLYVEMQHEGLLLASGSGADAIGGFELGKWQHLVVRVPFGGGPVLSGAGGATATLGEEFSTAGGAFGLEIGANSEAESTQAGACKVHLDNLVVTATP